jgi:hypothetical protein
VLSCALLAEGSTKFYIEYADRTVHTYDSHADKDVTSMLIDLKFILLFNNYQFVDLILFIYLFIYLLID